MIYLTNISATQLRFSLTNRPNRKSVVDAMPVADSAFTTVVVDLAANATTSVTDDYFSAVIEAQRVVGGSAVLTVAFSPPVNSFGFAHNFGAVEAKVANGILTAVTDLQLAAPVNAATAQPKTPRNVTVTTVDAGGANLAGTVTITGLSAVGATQTETITVVAGVSLIAGVKAWAKITNIAWTFGATGAAGDTIAVGTGDVLGVPIFGTTLVLSKVLEDGADVPVVAQANATYNTYSPTATPNATKIFQIWGSYRAGNTVLS